MATLSTHVLDTARGTPAEGIVIDLHLCDKGGRRHLKTTTTDAGGRPIERLCDNPLAAGTYELTFHAGEYLRAKGVELTNPPFLDEVVIRFGIADPAAHYHIPLLLSPYGYSTYRGS